MKRFGDWIATYSGRRFYPLDPLPEEVFLEDVAHALSLTCRFAGHVQRFYSVAEHSVHVSRMVPPAAALAGLLHDAGEAYLTDLPSPVKRHLVMSSFVDAEERCRQAAFRRFGLCPWPLPASVCEADKAVVALEAHEMFREPPEWVDDPGDLRYDDGRVVEVHGWRPEEAERQFLGRFLELEVARG